MPTREISLIAAIIVLVFVMLFTVQKISEFRSKNIISSKQAFLYVLVTFIQPILGFILIIPFIKKDA